MSGDYTQAAFLFKVKKTLRYTGLYGVSRTLAKIKGQYHAKASAEFEGARWENPACRNPNVPSRNVALIGCGNYSFSNIAYYLSKRNPDFLRSIYDIRRSRALSLCKAYGGALAEGDWTNILRDPQVKIVYIASNHASHAEYAIACIEAGKHVHIEKPHVVSNEQLERLLAAMDRHPEVQVFLGFNRPRSVLFRRLKDAVAQEQGPLMVNWFIAGHAISDDHWYFDAKEGGRVLGNLCHWTDLTLHLVGLDRAFPCRIISATPPGAKSDFVVSVIFADRSCASITFSAKGHTFEGVREVLNLHCGNVLANLSDFQSLTLDVIDRKEKVRLRYRDHGHEVNILNSYRAVSGGEGESRDYVAATARFFLAIREAIESGREVTLGLAEDIEAPPIRIPEQAFAS